MSDAITYRFVTGPDGNRLRVATQGQGPLVLMVHGWPDAWISWRPQMQAVADAGYMAAALDVRGYGESDAPHEVEAYTMLKLTGDNAAIIKALSHDGKAVMIGHDWGAPIVYSTALVHPDRVRAVIGLSSTPHKFEKNPKVFWREVYPKELFYQHYFDDFEGKAEAEFEADLDRFVRLMHYNLSGDAPGNTLDALVRPAGATTLLDGLPEPDPLPKWQTPEEIREYADLFRRNGMRGPLNRYRAQGIDWTEMAPYRGKKIQQPAIFVGGTREGSRFMNGYDRYSDADWQYADSRGVFFIEGAGHWLQREAPEQLNRHILNFLKTL